MAAESLECATKAAALPGRCETVAGTPAGFTRCSHELGAAAAAGQGTRTGTAAFASALGAAFNRRLDARFTVDLNSRLNAPVRPELAARLAALFAARLRKALTS